MALREHQGGSDTILASGQGEVNAQRLVKYYGNTACLAIKL